MKDLTYIPAWQILIPMLSKYKGVGTFDLAKLSGLQYAHIHNICDELVKKEIITKVKSGRKNSFCLTSKGEEMAKLLNTLKLKMG